VSGHPLHKFSNGHLPLHFRVKGRFGKIRLRQSSQQTHVVMARESVESDQFGGGQTQVCSGCAPMRGSGSSGAITGLLSASICRNPQPVPVNDLHICEVTEDFEHAPFARGRDRPEGGRIKYKEDRPHKEDELDGSHSTLNTGVLPMYLIFSRLSYTLFAIRGESY
jgi:hypothetical protein